MELLPKVAARPPIRHEAYALLRQAILRGQLPSGQRLVADELARALGVSRTPVREALTRLEVEGLVRATPGQGWSVATLSQADLAEALHLRLAVEGYAARLAAERIGPTELDELEALCRRTDEAVAADDLEAAAEASRLFHVRICEMSGVTRLGQVVAGLAEFMSRYRLALLGHHLFGSDSVAGHREILAALRAGDGEAAEQRVRAHIRIAIDLVGRL